METLSFLLYNVFIQIPRRASGAYGKEHVMSRQQEYERWLLSPVITESQRAELSALTEIVFTARWSSAPPDCGV